MPNEVTKLPDGRISAKLETGEVFEGDPLEVTQKMAEAHVHTKRWGQEWKAKAETVQPPSQTNQPNQPQQTTDPNEIQLQNYLGEQWAKWAGYKNGEEAKQRLNRVVDTTEKVNNNIVATEFMALCPDFPNTDAAVESLAKKIDEMHWDFTPQSMTAAHALLVREHSQDQNKGYAPLTPQQVNEAWSDRMQQANRPTPPPMLSGNNPELMTGSANDPYAMPLDQLRKMAQRQELEGKR